MDGNTGESISLLPAEYKLMLVNRHPPPTKASSRGPVPKEPGRAPGRVTLLPLAATIFFCVSGGPYGLEPLMQSGFGVAMLLLVVTPVVWAIPSALMTAELASMLPREGGYYIWVREGLGPFAGFLCAWWSWLYSWLDTALYPTLFFAYLNTLWKVLGHETGDPGPWTKWTVGLLLALPLTYLNVRGARPAGRFAVVSAAVLFAPFVVLCLAGLPHAIQHPPSGFAAADKGTFDALGAGLFIVMWNYLGWDSMSTIAGEVDRPARTFPRALLIGVPVVAATYALPMFVGAAAFRRPSDWTDGSWTSVASAIGGPWLAVAVTAAGTVSAAGMFSADLLSSSRIPFVLAEDGVFPSALARLSRRYRTPVVAILVTAVFCTVLSFESFKELLEVDVLMYSAALVLEFVALVVLRIKRPEAARPFRIPGGTAGAIVVAALPIAIVALGAVHMFGEQERFQTVASLAGIASGFLAYPICRAVSRRSRG